MKPDRDFKISVIYLFGIPGVVVSADASDIRKTDESVSHFIKTRVNGTATTKLIML